MVNSDRRVGSAPVADQWPSRGSVAIPSNAANHTAKRVPEFPEVPTISESGVPGFEAKSWFGLVAPAGTPADIINKINRDVIKVISDPAFADQYLSVQGLEPIVGTPEQFAAFLRSETVKWGKVVKDANITVTK